MRLGTPSDLPGWTPPDAPRLPPSLCCARIPTRTSSSSSGSSGLPSQVDPAVNPLHYVILKDLKSIRGLHHDAYIEPDITLDDLLADLYEQHVYAHQKDASLVALLRGRDDTTRSEVLHRLTGDKQLKKYSLAAVYGLIILLQTVVLCVVFFHPRVMDILSATLLMRLGLQFEGPPYGTEAAFRAANSIQVWPRTIGTDLHNRFDLLITVVTLPIPLCFAAVMFQAATLLQNFLNQTILQGLVEHIRRSINYVSRQAMDISLYDYRYRVDYFFRLKPEFESIGLPQLHQQLHSALDTLVAVRSSSAILPRLWHSPVPLDSVYYETMQQTKGQWRCLYLVTYVLPTVVMILVDYGTLAYVYRRYIVDGWYPELPSWHYFWTNPLDALSNEAFLVVAQLIASNILSWIWLLVVLENHFQYNILIVSGIFERATRAAASSANALIKRVWETVVVQGIYPYVQEARDPEYNWGQLHYQLEAFIRRLGQQRYFGHLEETHTYWDGSWRGQQTSPPGLEQPRLFPLAEPLASSEPKVLEDTSKVSGASYAGSRRRGSSGMTTQQLEAIASRTPDGIAWDPLLGQSNTALKRVDFGREKSGETIQLSLHRSQTTSDIPCSEVEERPQPRASV